MHFKIMWVEKEDMMNDRKLRTWKKIHVRKQKVKNVSVVSPPKVWQVQTRSDTSVSASLNLVHFDDVSLWLVHLKRMLSDCIVLLVTLKHT